MTLALSRGASVPPGRRRLRVAAALAMAFVCVVAVLVAAWGCAGSSLSRVLPVIAPPSPAPTAAQLVPLLFDDEFVGPAGSPVAASRWTNQIGAGWNNGRDEQCYTPGAHNAALTGRGTLLISARTEGYSAAEGTCAYTSARLISTASVQYGHVAARIRLSSVAGAFPAFWLLGASYPDVGWPASGELDVMETMNNAQSISYGIHGPESVGLNGYYWAGSKFTTPGASWAADWHVYSMDWAEDAVSWSVDGLQYARIDRSGLAAGRTWAVNQPSRLLVNMAVGGYAGTPAPGFAASMEIDWIRVS